MLGYHKNRVIHFGRQLQYLHTHRQDLKLLLNLQFQILDRVKHTESTILRYRETSRVLRYQLKMQRLPKDAAARLKRKIVLLDGKVKQSKWMLFVWRCFGDGIAFSYLDKWSLKPLLYNVHDEIVKQAAGHVTGKAGLDSELVALNQLADAGIPALLTDLTNCIRHGDICLLADNDPQLIEVKSSSNTNRRVERQMEDLRRIHGFLETDEAKNFHRLPHVKRVEMSLPERNYMALLDMAVSTALKEGVYIVEPEPGTRLIALTGLAKLDSAKVFEGMESSHVYMLNSAKNSETWGCYYPFSLALKSADNLYAFLHGDVCLIVAFDFVRIQSMAAAIGISFSLLDDPVWVCQFHKLASEDREPAIVKISRHFTDRMAFELLSWDWVLRLEQRRLVQPENELHKGTEA